MKLTLSKKIELAEKCCLNPAGCPFQKDCVTYEDRKQKCSNCKNVLDKVDLVELLRHFYTSTPSTTQTKRKRTGAGKSTELSKAEIKEILLLHKDGKNYNQICTELHLQFRTVKNVITKGFKNKKANEKVEEVENELES